MFTPKTSLDPEDAAQDQHSAPSAGISNFPISEVRVRRAWKFMALLIIARPLTPPKYEVLPAFYFDGISRPSEESKKKNFDPPKYKIPPQNIMIFSGFNSCHIILYQSFSCALPCFTKNVHFAQNGEFTVKNCNTPKAFMFLP